MIRISGRLSQIKPEEPKTVGEEVIEYSEVANQIIKERLAEQRRFEPATKGGRDRENGAKRCTEKEVSKDEKTSGGEDSDEDKIITVKHKVTMGDSYKTLALRYHTKTGVIKKWNKIRKPLKYMIGRELSIPVGRSYVEKPAEDLDLEVVFPHLMKAFLREAKDCEPARARYYLLDSNRDLKRALARWREDDKWEKSAGKHQRFKVLECPNTRDKTPLDTAEKLNIDNNTPQGNPGSLPTSTSQKARIEMEEIQVSRVI